MQRVKIKKIKKMNKLTMRNLNKFRLTKILKHKNKCLMLLKGKEKMPNKLQSKRKI